MDDNEKVNRYPFFLFLIHVAFAIVVATWFICTVVQAQEGQQRQSNDVTTLLLAKSFVAEGGWRSPFDHAGLAHTLKRRSDRLGIPFNTMIRNYVALFDRRTKKTNDVKWKLELNLKGTRPQHWPKTVSWTKHKPLWFDIIARAKAFQLGALADPCPGSWHWGGPMDKPSSGMIRIRCQKDTRNTFYRTAGQNF